MKEEKFGNITLINADCMNIMREIPDNLIDLIVADPPYEIVSGRSGGYFGFKNRSYHNGVKDRITIHQKRLTLF